MLEQEIATFERLLPSLVAEHGGVWAVVYADRLEGVFKTFEDAAHHALRVFGDAPFMIRHTTAPPASIPFLMVEA